MRCQQLERPAFDPDPTPAIVQRSLIRHSRLGRRHDDRARGNPFYAIKTSLVGSTVTMTKAAEDQANRLSEQLQRAREDHDALRERAAAFRRAARERAEQRRAELLERTRRF